jgi:hypothetical protein
MGYSDVDHRTTFSHWNEGLLFDAKVCRGAVGYVFYPWLFSLWSQPGSRRGGAHPKVTERILCCLLSPPPPSCTLELLILPRYVLCEWEKYRQCGICSREDVTLPCMAPLHLETPRIEAKALCIQPLASVYGPSLAKWNAHESQR